MTQELADAYDALSGVKPLDAVARVLREGLYTPKFLAALANRLDPSFEGELDEYRLILVSRDTLGQINQPARARRLEMVLDIVERWCEAEASGEIKKRVVADLCEKWSISKSTVYDITGGLPDFSKVFRNP